MKRKVQQLGSSTLAVTVPADWASHHGIEKGDELILQRDESGGSLLIVPEQPKTDEREATIAADALTADALRRAVVTQYVLGRQLITIECDRPLDPEHFNAVADAERQLMGLGVVEETPDRIAVRCSVAPADFDLPTLLGRLGRTERSMRTDAVTALIEGDEAAAERVLGRERQVKKLFYLFLRLLFATYRNPRLNRAVGIDTGFPLIGYRSVAQDTLLMADSDRKLAEMVTDGTVDGVPGPAGEHLAALAEAIDSLAEQARTAVVDPDYETTVEARDAATVVDERVAEAEAYLDAERPADVLALQRAVVLLERSARYATDSLSVATHLAFRETPDVVTHE